MRLSVVFPTTINGMKSCSGKLTAEREESKFARSCDHLPAGIAKNIAVNLCSHSLTLIGVWFFAPRNI